MQEVLADIGYLLMDAGNAHSLLVAVVRPWHFTREPALFPNELPCQLAQDTRIGNGIAITVGVELFQTNVDTDLPTVIAMEQIFNVLFHAQRYEIFARSRAADRSIQNSALEGTVLLDFHKADFRELEFSVYQADAVRLITRAVALAVAMLRLEARISGTLCKEVLICRVEVAQ